MKVKIFSYGSPSSAEKEVNELLANEKIKPIKMLQSESYAPGEGWSFTISIFYEEIGEAKE